MDREAPNPNLLRSRCFFGPKTCVKISFGPVSDNTDYEAATNYLMFDYLNKTFAYTQFKHKYNDWNFKR